MKKKNEKKTMHAVNIYNAQYRISYSKGIAVRNLIYSVIDK
jgi:hypothetical protein